MYYLEWIELQGDTRFKHFEAHKEAWIVTTKLGQVEIRRFVH